MKGKTRSLDVDMAKQSQPMQELAKQIKSMRLSYGDLTLYAAAAVFTSSLLMRDRDEVVRLRQIRAISSQAWDALEKLEKRRAHTISISPKGGEAMKNRGAKFTTRVYEHVDRRLKKDPRLTTDFLADEIEQLIGMDTAEIEQAKARGERWEDVVDLRFPRKNAKGDPYSRVYIIEKIQWARSSNLGVDKLLGGLSRKDDSPGDDKPGKA